MSDLHPIGVHQNSAVGDLVFVHGLGGNWLDTWSSDPRQGDTSWPNWLADQWPEINVWSLEYDAHRSGWKSSTSLIVQADQVLELLITKNIGARPILFVGHSLGGLLVKSVLRASFDAKDPPAQRIFAKTRGIAFFATPHSGAKIASAWVRIISWLGPVGQLYRITPLVEELKANSSSLRQLNVWYRNNVFDEKTRIIANRIYYETLPLFFGFLPIVDASTADPGIPGIRPVPVPANHFDICKFSGKTDWLYESVTSFLTGCISAEEADKNLETADGVTKTLEFVVKGKIPTKMTFDIDTSIANKENLKIRVTRTPGPI